MGISLAVFRSSDSQPYFVPGPVPVEGQNSAIQVRISPGLSAALAQKQADDVVYWQPYGSELRSTHPLFGSQAFLTGWRPYVSSFFQTYVAAYYTPAYPVEVAKPWLSDSPPDQLGLALAGVSLGATGLGSQSNSYSDLASAVSDGFSLLKKLAPLAGKVGVKAVPYLGFASTALDFLAKILDLLGEKEGPPDPVKPSDPELVYALPGEFIPIGDFGFDDSDVITGIEPSHNSRVPSNSLKSAAETVNALLYYLQRQISHYVVAEPDTEPFTWDDWGTNHQSAMDFIIEYFRRYFKFFGQLMELSFSMEWLTVDPVDFVDYYDFVHGFLSDYVLNLGSIVSRAFVESPEIFQNVTNVTSFPDLLKLSIPDGLLLPDFTSYFAGRTHLNLEDSIETSGLVMPYAVVQGHNVSYF